MKTQKSLLIVLFFVSVICATLLPLIQCNQKQVASYHHFLQTEKFKKLSRERQITKCGTCHKQEYENELKGPHANAYQKLLAHRTFVNSDKYDCYYYTAFVNKSFQDCLGCHTPQNLLQTVLYDSLNQPLQFAEKLLQIDHPRPLTRTVNAEKKMSIDCISCHFDGNDMVSLKHKFVADDSIAAKQTKAQIVFNNQNCYVCHADVVRNFNPVIAIRQTGSALCVNCHLKQEANGNSTHYFYWQHDEADKRNPNPEKLMDDFHLSFSPDKKRGIIIWQNTFLPHKISPCSEMILYCKVLDKDSAVLGSTTIHINKKKEFDEEMYKNLNNNYHRGVLGNDIPLNGEKLEYSFLVKNSEKAAYFSIAFLHKSQYWFADSLAEVTAVKIYNISK